MERIFIDEKTGNYYGVRSNGELNSFAVDISAEDGVFTANNSGKVEDYVAIKEIFDKLNPINKQKLFLFIEKQNHKRYLYLVPETMVSFMDKYADEWCDDVTPLEFVIENQESFLNWFEGYVCDSLLDGFDSNYYELIKILEEFAKMLRVKRLNEEISREYGIKEIYGTDRMDSIKPIYDKKELQVVPQEDDILKFLKNRAVQTFLKEKALRLVKEVIKEVNLSDMVVDILDALETEPEKRYPYYNFQISVRFSCPNSNSDDMETWMDFEEDVVNHNVFSASDLVIKKQIIQKIIQDIKFFERNGIKRIREYWPTEITDDENGNILCSFYVDEYKGHTYDEFKKLLAKDIEYFGSKKKELLKLL